MQLSDFITLANLSIFIIYIIAVNFIGKKQTHKTVPRPPVKPFTFFPKTRNDNV